MPFPEQISALHLAVTTKDCGLGIWRPVSDVGIYILPCSGPQASKIIFSHYLLINMPATCRKFIATPIIACLDQRLRHHLPVIAAVVLMFYPWTLYQPFLLHWPIPCIHFFMPLQNHTIVYYRICPEKNAISYQQKWIKPPICCHIPNLKKWYSSTIYQK